ETPDAAPPTSRRCCRAARATDPRGRRCAQASARRARAKERARPAPPTARRARFHVAFRLLWVRPRCAWKGIAKPQEYRAFAGGCLAAPRLAPRTIRGF